LQDPILEKSFTKIGLVEWLKAKGVSSSPSITHTQKNTAPRDMPQVTYFLLLGQHLLKFVSPAGDQTFNIFKP
jgi:hypothetical protein